MVAEKQIYCCKAEFKVQQNVHPDEGLYRELLKAKCTANKNELNCQLLVTFFFYFLGDPSCFLDAVSVVSNQHPLLYFTCFPPLSSIFTSYPMLMFQAFPTITTFRSYFLSIIPATMLFSHEKQLSPPSIITRSHVNYAFFPFFFFPYNFLISN